MTILIGFLFLLTHTVYSEKSGPYVYWKPAGARLELPQTYGAPFSSELTNSQVNFAAKVNAQQNSIVATTTESLPTTTTDYEYETTTLDREYLPPPTESNQDESNYSLQAQGLPNLMSANDFNQGKKPENAKFSEWDDFKSQFFASQYRLHSGPRNGQLRVASRVNFQQEKLGRLEQEVRSMPSSPMMEYGTPLNVDKGDDNTSDVESVEDGAQENTSGELNNEQQESEDDSSENDSSQSDPNQDEQSTITAPIQGQYFILAPDNTLQRVMYAVVKTEDDVKSKGFTAQLKYAPVEPITDPVYGYNEMGQLIKLYKK